LIFKISRVIVLIVFDGRVNMKIGKYHGMRNAVVAALFLFSIGMLANMYMNTSELRKQNRAIAGAGSYDINQQIVVIPVSSYLPVWMLHREAPSISRGRNASVLKSVFEVFDPLQRPYLTSVPIVLDPSAVTAKAYPKKGYIGVSPDWDNTVVQSRYRAVYEQRGMKPDEAVFMPRFKTDLLIHEFLHMLQARQKIDSRLFYEAIVRWYLDPRYGIPSPIGKISLDSSQERRTDAATINRVKYILWHELYNYRNLSNVPRDDSWKIMQYRERYRSAEKGVEEFAYTGQEILASGSSSDNYMKTFQWSDKDWQSKKTRLSEVSPEVIAFFNGVFNPELIK
jgi:hypothetical protein